MSYLEQLPNDLIELIYHKKHKLDYRLVMNQINSYNVSPLRYYSQKFKIRLGDSVSVNDKLYVVIWKGKKYIDLYDYISHTKNRMIKSNITIIPSTADYIIKEIFS